MRWSMSVCTVMCCIGYGAAALWDEKERQVPRLLSYFVCAGALAEVFAQWKQGTVHGLSQVFSLGFFLVIWVAWRKGLVGKADVYIVFSMVLLLGIRGNYPEVLFGESLFFVLAFAGAGIRMIFPGKKRGCPLISHLFFAFLWVRLMIL